MVKKRIQRATLFLLCFSCLLLLSGCSGKVTPKKLMKAMEKNLSETTSVTTTLEMDIKLEKVLHTTSISMDMQMENTAEPKAGHAKGNAEVNFSGTKLGSEIEIYQVTENDEHVTYSSMYDEWSREVSEGTGSGSFDGSLFHAEDDSLENFRVAEEPVEVSRRECYEMYGTITGTEFLQFIGLDMIEAFGLVEIPDESAVLEMQIPITIDVYKEELLPARVKVDMTDVMNEMYERYDMRTDVNDFTIKLGYTGFDEVKEIRVPEEVKAACE